MRQEDATTVPGPFLEWFEIQERDKYRKINGKIYHYAEDYLNELNPDELRTTTRTANDKKGNTYTVKNSFYWFRTNTPETKPEGNPKILAEDYYPFNVSANNNKKKKLRFYEYAEKCIDFLKFCGCVCGDDVFDRLVVDHIDYDTTNASICNLVACNQNYNQYKKTNSLILNFLPVGSELLQHIGVFNNVAFDLYIWENSLFILRVCMLWDEFKPPTPLIGGEFFKILTNSGTLKTEIKEIIKKHKNKQQNKDRARILSDYMKVRAKIANLNKFLAIKYKNEKTQEGRERITEEINRNARALMKNARTLADSVK